MKGKIVYFENFDSCKYSYLNTYHSCPSPSCTFKCGIYISKLMNIKTNLREVPLLLICCVIFIIIFHFFYKINVDNFSECTDITRDCDRYRKMKTMH